MPKSQKGARVSDNIIHISELKTFRRCPMKHHYSYIEDLSPKQVSIKLSKGSFIHKLLEIWYGKGTKKAKKASIEKQFKEWEVHVYSPEANVPTEEREVEVNSVKQVWASYLLSVKTLDKGFKTKAVEHNFHIPLPGTDLILSGTIDLVLTKSSGGLWVMEHKTGAIDRLSHIMSIDDQLSNYFYATYKEFGVLPRGVILNFIRTKPISRPRILKDGTVSRAKCATDQATYTAVVKEAGEKLKDYAPFISTFPKILIPQRFSTNRTKAQIMSFMGEVARCALACRSQTGKYRNPTWDCTWDCEHMDLCMIDYTGGVRETHIEERYEQLTDEKPKLKLKPKSKKKK